MELTKKVVFDKIIFATHDIWFEQIYQHILCPLKRSFRDFSNLHDCTFKREKKCIINFICIFSFIAVNKEIYVFICWFYFLAISGDLPGLVVKVKLSARRTRSVNF